MKKLWNDWSGPVAFTLGWTLLLAAALLMPNVPVWADEGGLGMLKKCAGDICNTTCQGCSVSIGGLCTSLEFNGTCHCTATPPAGKSCDPCACKAVHVDPEDITSEMVFRCR
ncbi:MAG TPA: hypothetical protein PKC18_00885 [Lacipirellulaceae bacterium]|nr:hypothetical protein [Lacipirellulaceae bacterium]